MDETEQAQIMKGDQSLVTKRLILTTIKNQMAVFDHKAEIELSTVGILLGLSLTFLGLAVSNNAFYVLTTAKIAYLCIVIIYLLLVALVITYCFIIIYPRTKKGHHFDMNYYRDIALFPDKYDLLSQNFKEDSTLDFQIKENATICLRKEVLLSRSIFALIPLGLTLLCLVVTTFFI